MWELHARLVIDGVANYDIVTVAGDFRTVFSELKEAVFTELTRRDNKVVVSNMYSFSFPRTVGLTATVLHIYMRRAGIACTR